MTAQALLDDRQQMMFDVIAEREQRRQQRGFASPADARALLQMSRTVTPESIAANPMASAYARAIETPEHSVEAAPATVD